MKRNERHHLKENELVQLASRTREVIDARQREVGAVAIAVILVAVAAIGYYAWRSRVEGRAGSMLADAVILSEARVGPPPAPGTPATGPSFPTEREKYEATAAKFKAVADEYPSTDAGVFARYREGSTQMALGNTKEAAAAYQQVIDRAGTGSTARWRGSVSPRRRRATGSTTGDQHLQGAGRQQGRPAAGRRHPDAARAHLPRGRQGDRGPADVQSGGRGIPRVAVQRRCPHESSSR